MVDREVILRVAREIGELTVEKNEAYGDSFARSSEILRVLYPEGVRPEQYQDLLGVARLIDKMFRIATRKNAFGESPWRDICGYGLIAAASEIVAADGLGEKKDDSQVKELMS
ncbi:hypothetical protein [Methanocella sp. MCL-LM]|uniref:hypothetical protein n=1 Tax=Methanocella sp. MCL-LM TaxID=3412035 RepID=UPI003C782FD7